MRPNSLILIKKNGKLLVQKYTDKKSGVYFCRPLGGGIEFGETSLFAIKREIKEELGVEIKKEKLLSVIENIFIYNGKKGHEITFLYSGELVDINLYKKEKIKILDKKSDFAEWISISDIKKKKIKIYPEESSKFI